MMTLDQIQKRAGSIATFTTGSADDLRDMAACVHELAKRQMEFAQVIHDAVPLAAPKLGCAISDWIEDQSGQLPLENTEACNAGTKTK